MNYGGGFDGGYGGMDQGQGFGGGFGGGFNSPGPGGGGFNSPGVGTSQSKGKRAQKLIPCNIAQILQATQNDNEFKIGDVEIHQVCLIGVIRRAEISATNIVYQLDDMSGPTMEIRQWIESDETTEQQPTVYEENTYIKVAGNIRSFGGKRSVGPFRIMPVTDMNEVTMHMAEVVQSHMLLSKMATMAGNAGGGNVDSNFFQTPVKAGHPAGGMIPNNGLSDVQTQVHQLITGCRDEEGISMDALCRKLQRMSRDAIRKAVEFLSSEGHIYSTIDDDHFKSTEG